MISVTKEWKEAGSNFIQGKYDGNLLTYKETTNGRKSYTAIVFYSFYPPSTSGLVGGFSVYAIIFIT